jgi:hypothetical protein
MQWVSTIAGKQRHHWLNATLVAPLLRTESARQWARCD